jgi:hypothetical protein
MDSLWEMIGKVQDHEKVQMLRAPKPDLPTKVQSLPAPVRSRPAVLSPVTPAHDA